MAQIINKVVYGGETLIDLTHDTVTTDDVKYNVKFHKPSGETAQGTMPVFNNFTGIIHSRDDSYPIPLGYHNGTGVIEIEETQREKLIAQNIREGINVLGIEGTMSDIEGMRPTQITVIPGVEQQTFIPEELGNFNSIEQVTVNPIPIIENDNDYGGKTVTIGIKAGGE